MTGRESSGAHTAVLIDPDQFDTSEQQFAASLDVSNSAASEPLPARAYARVMLQSTAPKLTEPDVDVKDWRNQVTSRVKQHRTKRGYEDDSMSLTFGDDPSYVAESSAPVRTATAVAEAAPAPYLDDEADPLHLNDYDTESPARPTFSASATAEAESESMMMTHVDLTPPETVVNEPVMRTAKVRRPRTQDRDNIIEFPKTQGLFDNELAEPIASVPRILEAEPVVEEPSVRVPQPIATITLDESATDWQRAYLEPYEDSDIELPLAVAPFAPRMMCLLVDGVLSVAAAAIFGFVAVSMTHYMPQGKAALGAALVLPALFWSAYQMLFLTYCGTTPGMQMSQLEMCDFEGYFPRRNTRQGRALALMLSVISCGMGFAWTLVDEDALGWHDRITRTYLRLS
jgi:uncharacterized RDD family membrane protein YckC